ncbi:MAG: helix-turn-helix transcriptional regulator [Clostridia bacterium]|nr:helix-turn-helix transcriptional regulator [Clostridia bacterium]
MSTSVSTRLVSLRKEKNLSQKEASSALGVSQALLSHYEKGIRECGLDFLCRASAFYDVSTDYLLGLTDNKMMSDALFDEQEIPQDSEMRMSTVFRSSVYLMNRLSVYGRNYSSKIRTIYVLTIYKLYLAALSQGAVPNHEAARKELAPYLTTTAIDNIINSMIFDGEGKPKRSEQLPRTMDTIINEATRVIEKEVAKIYKITNKTSK